MLIQEFWKVPFLRFVLPLILGIVIEISFQPGPASTFNFALLFVFLAFVYHLVSNNSPSYKHRWVFGFLITMAIVFIGCYLTSQHTTYTTQIANSNAIIGVVNKPIKETAKSIKAEIAIDEYELDGIWKKDHSTIIVYLQKDSLAQTLKYGDLLLLKGKLQEIENSGNPHEFDYSKYLSRKKIHYRSYQTSLQWQRMAKNKGNFIYTTAYHVRNKVLAIYKNAGLKNDEFALLAALTLGVKDYLSADIIEDYSESGAMHVLAVSGLHVGIITMVLNILLFPLRKKRKLILLHSIIIIGAIWFFALITGLAPSVTRASLMFSLFIIGKNSGKRPSPFNSLAAAAFIILVINPLSLFQVGFQLSFLAVTSILFFQPRIYRLWDVKTNWGDKAWQLATVSIAAQIGTTPISIFYFHQFPVYGLFTNFIAIPGAFVLMAGAIVLIIFSFSSVIAKLWGFLLSNVIALLNASINFIEELPMSSIKYISLNKIELWMLYVLFGMVILLILTKRKKLIFYGLFIAIVLFGMRAYRYYSITNADQFIVFNTNRKPCLATLKNRKITIYADSSLAANKKSLDYLTTNLMTHNFVKKRQTKPLFSNQNKAPVTFIQFDSLKIAYCHDKLNRFDSKNSIELDLLILGKNSSPKVDEYTRLFSYKQLILDASVQKWKQTLISKDCIDKKIPFYNVSEQGAFVLNTTQLLKNERH